jgi:caffeoyl-CoA O-methyltransferase
MPQSSAKLVIDRPERYAKQLASHIGHKAQAISEADGITTVTFGFGGTGTIAVESDAVLLTGDAGNQEDLEKIQNILGKHLLKFAKLEDQQLDWN